MPDSVIFSKEFCNLLRHVAVLDLDSGSLISEFTCHAYTTTSRKRARTCSRIGSTVFEILKCRIAILRCVDRLAEGNAGDAKFCGNGVWELRVDCGPGYRVYFAPWTPPTCFYSEPDPSAHSMVTSNWPSLAGVR